MKFGNVIVGRMSVKQWLVKRRYFGTTSGYSHLFLDGGKASVPNEHLGSFLNVYANGVLRGESVSLSECRTPIFKLFVDLDGQCSSPPQTEAIREVFTVFQACSKTAFQCEDPSVIACGTEPKGSKHGYHLVWKNVFVDVGAASAFRSLVIDELAKKFEVGALFDNPWEKVYDAAVYKGSGLRMIYATKGAEDPRVYVPHYLLDNEGCTPLDHQGASFSDKRKWIHATSIRNFEQPATPSTLQVDSSGTGPIGGGAFNVSLGQYAQAVADIDAILPPQYVGQQFTGLVKTATAFYLRSSSTYCGNLGRKHNSNVRITPMYTPTSCPDPDEDE